MKKSILLIAAMFAAFTVSAKEITVDLSKAAEMAYTGCSATFNTSDGVLNVNYSAGKWEWAGVEIPLDNLTNVTNIDFQYKGQAAVWTGFIVYLRDTEGTRWYDNTFDLSIPEAEWSSQTGYVPNADYYDSPSHKFGEKPFVKLGIIANPCPEETGTQTGSFNVRNVKITADWATSIDNTASEVKAIKTIKDGQMVIVRDGKSYNALGAEMK